MKFSELVAGQHFRLPGERDVWVRIDFDPTMNAMRIWQHPGIMAIIGANQHVHEVFPIFLEAHESARIWVEGPQRVVSDETV